MFDFIYSNPPYQEEQEGDNKTFAPPIYHKFIDGAYEAGEHVELIHPARFLFNAGSTPKAWNQKMLEDEHLKVLYYEANSAKIFPNTDIKGGIAITYWDEKEKLGPIKTFTAFPELNSILSKVNPAVESSLASVIYTQNRFDLNALYDDYPELQQVIGSGGKDKRFRNNIFEKVPAFTDAEIAGGIHVLGISQNKRVWKWIDRKYVDMTHENLCKYKVFVARANGSGALGEILSTPLVASPFIGHTQSFISVGSYDTETEANATLKYLKSKFSRVMLGILKITQDNDRGVWKYVPLQDFTASSDIDWSVSIPEIDRQLYAKYGLDEDEIEFIETHVKEMA